MSTNNTNRIFYNVCRGDIWWFGRNSRHPEKEFRPCGDCTDWGFLDEAYEETKKWFRKEYLNE